MAQKYRAWKHKRKGGCQRYWYGSKPSEKDNISALAYRIKRALQPYSEKIEIAGSIRRRQTPNDIDMAVVPKDKEKIKSIMRSKGKPYAEGDTYCSYNVDGIKVDIYFTQKQYWGGLMLQITGPAGSNIGKRTIARDKGMILNHKGLFDRKTGKPIATRTETAIYKALDRPYKKPHDRYGQPKLFSSTPYIPPGWKNVKFPKNKPYIAIGIDKKGRKQYIYDKKMTKRMANQKFDRVEQLEKKIPKTMPKIVKDAEDGKQEAQAVYTMFKTGFRPGTETETKADKEAFGALSLRNKHVKINGDNVKFHFPAKKGTVVDKEVRDKKLAKIMNQRTKEEHVFDISSGKVRRYFQKKVGDDFKLKDLRTLKALNTAKATVRKMPRAAPCEVKKAVGQAVSQDLSNTEKVALASYVAPKVVGG